MLCLTLANVSSVVVREHRPTGVLLVKLSSPSHIFSFRSTEAVTLLHVSLSRLSLSSRRNKVNTALEITITGLFSEDGFVK